MSDNYDTILDEVIRKKCGNDIIVKTSIKFMKFIKLLLKDDYKTQRFIAHFNKIIYVK